MTELWCRKIRLDIPLAPGGREMPRMAVLAPADALSEETLSKLPEDVTLRVQASQPRDGGKHRYMFALFKTAYDALPEGWDMSFDTFRKALTVDAGFYEEVRTPDGNIIQLPLSISYGAMDQTEHDAFKDAIIKCLVTRWIPGLESDVFENEVFECLR